MGKIEKKLVGYLWKHCRGKEHAISKDDLAAELGISTRELRRIKRDIVIKEGKRIGSFEGGYFYAKTKREIEIFKNGDYPLTSSTKGGGLNE